RLTSHACSHPLRLSGLFSLTTPRPPRSTPFPYTTLFRSISVAGTSASRKPPWRATGAFAARSAPATRLVLHARENRHTRGRQSRSEEHTSELQSRENLVCRLLLEKKKEETVEGSSGITQE